MLNDLTGIPVIAYKCVAQMEKEDWKAWLDQRLHKPMAFPALSLVGAAHRNGFKASDDLARSRSGSPLLMNAISLWAAFVSRKGTDPAKAKVKRMLHKGCKTAAPFSFHRRFILRIPPFNC